MRGLNIYLLFCFQYTQLPPLRLHHPQSPRRTDGSVTDGLFSPFRPPLLSHHATNRDTAETIVTGGKASVLNLEMNHVKFIVWRGVLDLPAGIASIDNPPTALVLVPTTYATLAMSAMYVYFFFVKRVCHVT